MWVSWGLSVSLTAVPAALTAGGTTALTASANVNVGPTPWFIVILDSTTGTVVAVCGSGTTCSTTVTMAGCAVHTYNAYISATSNPPTDVRAVSSSVVASWLVVSLSASPAQPAPGGTVTLTATTCLNVGPTPYFIRIYDLTGGTMTQLGSGAGSGTSFSAVVKIALRMKRTFWIVAGLTPLACRCVTHSRTWLAMISFIRIGPNQGMMCLLSW